MEAFGAIALVLLIFLSGQWVGEIRQKAEIQADCERMGKARLHNDMIIECRIIEPAKK